MTARLLLLGATGQVGRALHRLVPSGVEVSAPPRAALDLGDPAALERAVAALRPRVVVNAAAYTAVDRAESDADRCRAVNAAAPAALARACARAGAALVHYSTNFVFDGTAARAYVEGDAAAPLNVYGTTKLEGERAIARVLPRHLVLRTALVFSREGESFVQRVLRLARERERLTVVHDQWATPTSAGLLAELTLRAIAPVLGGGEIPWGVYHLTAAGSTSIHAYALKVLALDPDRGAQRCREVVPVSSAEFHAAARRPLNGVLDSAHFAARFGVTLPPWEEGLERELAAP